MKRIIVLLGLVASTGGGFALVSDVAATSSPNSPAWKSFNNHGLVVQSGYEGTNEDGDRESVGTSM
ncbi:hypothetical protein AmaxDRAFT_4761 [Limnospira maxima CS-328]|uniref:Uncharacterized protein n=1 Tax=Limnospira maxima CS-328 TaxID=513049 RepID=B5W7L1_LIMMA|nr:hypothetical protein AmaxDRAFT_4761 [Limnospira maxima CS-328]QNH55609.1 MAG: hypothetical protein H2674_14205 [Limnospira indica BM01]RAQ38791.1 hypothetical protein B9S53_25385 [Arthrospira sp. O9.13F]UWU48416.1 hypothetical protein APLC1_3210 [Arthrospira platensis C1]